jgi:hypothetical protein
MLGTSIVGCLGRFICEVPPAGTLRQGLTQPACNCKYVPRLSTALGLDSLQIDRLHSAAVQQRMQRVEREEVDVFVPIFLLGVRNLGAVVKP